MLEPCCEMMRAQLEWRCSLHDDLAKCPDSLIQRWSDEGYGLRVHDGGSAVIAIAFCPWCGSDLAGR